MSFLIDSFTHNQENINGKWYIAKTIQFVLLKRKLLWCKEILQGKAIAVHFKVDEGN